MPNCTMGLLGVKGRGGWILSQPKEEATASPKQSHGAIRHKVDPVSRATLEWLIAHGRCIKILTWLRGLSDKMASFFKHYDQFLFFVSPSSESRETRKWPRAWLKARDGRGFSGCRPRFSRLAALLLDACTCTLLTKSDERETARSITFHDSIVSQFRREASTKKTKPNIEKWPESLGVMLEF